MARTLRTQLVGAFGWTVREAGAVTVTEAVDALRAAFSWTSLRALKIAGYVWAMVGGADGMRELQAAEEAVLRGREPEPTLEEKYGAQIAAEARENLRAQEQWLRDRQGVQQA